MGSYSKNLDLEYGMEDGVVIWTLISPFSYTANDGTVYTAPVGFKTDLASIPQIFWSIIPPFWRYAKAAVIHDYMLSSLKVDPRVANSIFKEGMLSLNVNRTQIFLIYNSVCLHFWLKKL